MSRNFLVVSVVSFAFACCASTLQAQCDASPGSCGCTAEINQCGNNGRLFKSCGCSGGNCRLGNGQVRNIGGMFRGNGACGGSRSGGCGPANSSCGCSGGGLGGLRTGGCSAGGCSTGGCNSGGYSSGGCSTGGCSTGGCSGGARSGGGLFSGAGGLLPRVNVSFGNGQGCGNAGGVPNQGGLCGLFTAITGFSATVTRGQNGNAGGCNCGSAGVSPALSQGVGCGGCSGGGCGCGNGGGRYYKLMAGWNFIEDDDELEGIGSTNEGFLVGFARGRRINHNTRFEFESSWRNNSGNFTGATPLDGRVNVFSPTVNLYRDFGSGSLRPYVGGGIGVAFQDAEFTTGEVDDFAFAYQAAVGLALNTRPGKDWFVEYRYYGNTDTDLELGGATIGEVSYEATNLIFGFRERF